MIIMWHTQNLEYYTVVYKAMADLYGLKNLQDDS